MAACPPLSNHKVTWPAPEGHPSKKERVWRPPPENRTCGCQCLHSFKTMEAMDTNTDWLAPPGTPWFSGTQDTQVIFGSLNLQAGHHAGVAVRAAAAFLDQPLGTTGNDAERARGSLLMSTATMDRPLYKDSLGESKLWYSAHQNIY
jgi:hypothetical protein